MIHHISASPSWGWGSTWSGILGPGRALSQALVTVASPLPPRCMAEPEFYTLLRNVTPPCLDLLIAAEIWVWMTQRRGDRVAPPPIGWAGVSGRSGDTWCMGPWGPGKPQLHFEMGSWCPVAR